MIDLYGTGSPNVIKVAIMLEEIERPYSCHHVNVARSAQFTPSFLALNPLGKVPVIVDHEGPGIDQPIFESGAILIYLAETYGPELLPRQGPGRWEVLKWLIVQVAYAGPMLGQLNHFQLVSGQSQTYAADRYRDQAARVYGDVENRLGSVPWLGGDRYSIADIAMYPWVGYLRRHGFDAADFPNIAAWRGRLDERAAVQRARAVIASMMKSDESMKEPVSDPDIDRFFARSKPGPPADFATYYALGPMA
jgi:GSH-dependent disulfide-bond oxidoreductase